MRVTSNQKTDTNTVELEIAVTSEELKAATDKVFRKKAKTINVPGFRKGKAPRQIIEKMYGEGIFLEDAVNDLYPKVYSEAVEETEIDPVDRANVEILTLDKETGFTFKATVTVKPEVTLGEFKNLAAEKLVTTVVDSDVDDEIDRMRERNSRIINVEGRTAQDGDTTIINFEGFIDGIPFEGGKGDDYQLVLGSNSFIAGFEEQIIGHGIDEEFDVNVTFPEEYHAEELKGKPAVFKVKVNEVKAKELPELDDEFAKDVSEFDTLDELRADIKTRLQETRDRQDTERLENKLMDQVVDGMQAEIPECMYEQRIDEMIQDFDYRLSSQGMNLDIYLQYTGSDMETFRKTFRDQAERQVKIRLALSKIIELEKIEASEADIDEQYSKMAEAYNMEVDKVRAAVSDKDIAQDIKSQKAIDLVRDTAIITEKAVEAEASDEDGEKEAPAKKKPATRTKTAKKDVDSETTAEE